MRRLEDEASKRLRTGLTPLVIEPLGPKSTVYRYDPTRPDAIAARQVVDDVLQRAQGRTDPRSSERRLRRSSQARDTSIF